MSAAHPQKGLNLPSLSLSLASDLAKAVAAEHEKWDAAGCTQRLWREDASLWTNADEGQCLGWLTIVDRQLRDVSRFKALAAEIAEDGFADLVLLGMGGASLCPQAFSAVFGKQPNAPDLSVLDSIDPAQIRALREKIDPGRTLFCVSSKSGMTLEPDLCMLYFHEETRRAVGADRAGHHFIAVTDPESKLERVAQDLAFRRVYHGVNTIGTSYSALSDFGMIPLAGMGLDTEKFLRRTQLMVDACQPPEAARNPGINLGLILGTAATQFGRDKVSLIFSPTLRDFGGWVEQLLAGSTGKNGRGLIPVDREPILTPGSYGQDRIFVYIQYGPDSDPSDAAVKALERAGQPVVRLLLKDLYDLGQVFFQWEMATAVAASIIGINAFQQADTEAGGANGEPSGKSSGKPSIEQQPILEHGGIKIFADKATVAELLGGVSPTVGGLIRKHLDRVKTGDYLALLAYLPMFPEHETTLQGMRKKILEAKRVTTVLGFGSRFLHSTGRAYLEGPNSGVFLQITCEETSDLPVPGTNFTFGKVKAAEAQRYFQALAEGQRRVLRVHLGRDINAGLARLRDLVCAALAH